MKKKDEKREYGLIFRADNLTQNEMDKLSTKIKSAKKDVTSDEARGTLIEGRRGQLAEKVRNLLGRK
jgi:hypothetical protein